MSFCLFFFDAEVTVFVRLRATYYWRLLCHHFLQFEAYNLLSRSLLIYKCSGSDFTYAYISKDNIGVSPYHLGVG